MRSIRACAAAIWLAATAVPVGAQPADFQDTLAGTAWVLMEWDGQPDKFERAPNLVFGPGNAVSSWGSCNRFAGAYRVSGTRIAIAAESWTKMWCGQDNNLTDSKFGADLKRIVRLEPGAGGTLVARGPEESVLLRFRRAAAGPAR